MQKKQFVGIMLLLLVCSVWSCRNKPPQLPANKHVYVDSTAIRLTKINEVLIAKEDSMLTEYVKTRNTVFEKHPLGFWYRITKQTNGKIPQENEQVQFSYTAFSLSDEKLEEYQTKITIGKKETIIGVEEGVKMLHRGEKAEFVLPWYLAYGMKGNGSTIPPYCSLVIYLQLHE